MDEKSDRYLGRFRLTDDLDMRQGPGKEPPFLHV